MPLPTYPFQRKRHWLDAPAGNEGVIHTARHLSAGWTHPSPEEDGEVERELSETARAELVAARAAVRARRAGAQAAASWFHAIEWVREPARDRAPATPPRRWVLLGAGDDELLEGAAKGLAEEGATVERRAFEDLTGLDGPSEILSAPRDASEALRPPARSSPTVACASGC